MDSMRSRVHELERECSTMKKAIEKIDQLGPSGGAELAGLADQEVRMQVQDSGDSTFTNDFGAEPMRSLSF
ncbi:hypothetical protein CK203_103344 [Vitis vinifera]|uniref:Uncharacterized protein n=1 Tax=Vitis vinifera TaxID=29760 RepID=A0A438FB58_VITVI|nr:hypothetical protein CK203_103344 [Vitis vinifera]